MDSVPWICEGLYLKIVKLTSRQLVGESTAAISMPLDAIFKLEDGDYYGKRQSESAV